MQILIKGKPVEELLTIPYVPEEKWGKFIYNLPRDAEQLFHVQDADGNDYRVDEHEVWKYPRIKINYHDAGFKGVNKKGIALIAIDISQGLNDNVIDLPGYPSYVCQYGETTQAIYRIENFLPRRASGQPANYLQSKTSRLEFYFNGKATDKMLNPYCRSVTCYSFVTDGFSHFKEIIVPNLPPEEIKERQAEAGRTSAAKRKRDSIADIARAVKEVIELGLPMNRKQVADRCSVSRITVGKHWDCPEIESLREGYKGPD